ncbi:MAG: 16S rRNA (adenine(1518)-N(6)/adenine(1519)-N(6))-dimethyltransferase RsmA [Melioribacteraceae bacterium]|nr:16S rRNA (adenine(1518)-N(6)/adenine(1519)-N(6))-dimethyltransferase RsmA [Melioribacteraceae bacterium]
MGIKPLKKFGQNYLTDKNIVKKMIDCIEIDRSDSVLEIGPGKGFITNELYGICNKLIGIEIDSRVIDELHQRFPDMSILHGDFIKLDIKDTDIPKPIKIIGNIPFNQTGNILFKLIDYLDLVSEAVLIIPLDIAKRIVAESRTKEYGVLSVVFKYCSDSRLVSKLSKNVFFPKPNIEGGIIHLKFNKKLREDIDLHLFIKIVKAAFGNRRKTIINSFRNSIFKDCDFSRLELPLNWRAEEFSLNEFLIITEYLQEQACLKKMN